MYQQLTRASGSQNNTGTMMLFALVEVVMIVVGIVMANRLEQQKELNDVMEDAKVLLLEVLDDLDRDIATSATVIRHHASASALADIVFHTPVDVYALAEARREIYRTIRFYSTFDIHNKGYQGLETIHEDLPTEWIGLYESLGVVMERTAVIEEYNKRYREVIYDNIDHNIQHHAWWNFDTHLRQQGEDFVAWSATHEAQAQVHRALNYIANLAHVAIQYRLGAIDMYRDIHAALEADFPIPDHHYGHPYTLSNIKDIAGEYTRIETPNDLGHFPKRLDLTVKDSTLVCTEFRSDSRSKGRELLVLSQPSEMSTPTMTSDVLFFSGDKGRQPLFKWRNDTLDVIHFSIERDSRYVKSRSN